MKLIDLDASHIDDCRQIYRESVLAVDDAVYSLAQKQSWASYADSEAFPGFVLCGHACGTIENDRLTGFASATRAGHINSLYVHPSNWGKSCASRMLACLLHRFDDRQTLTVDASKLSLPVFLKFGFSVVEEEIVGRQSVKIARYKMRRRGDTG